MKKILQIGTSIAVLSALVVVPIISHAQIKTNFVTGSNVNIDGALGTGDYNSGSSTNSTLTSESNLDLNGNIEADARGDFESDADSQSESNTMLKINSSGVAITSASQVNSDEDLEVFSSNVSSENNLVSDVQIESENDGTSEVEVMYKHAGRLFGIFPIMVTTKTVVETKADGEVEVKSQRPWYSFLVSGESYSQSEVESRIKNNSTVKANATVNASASAKAQIAEAIIAEMEAYMETRAQASVNN